MDLTNVASSLIGPSVLYWEKNKEQCSHIAVVLKFHVDEQDGLVLEDQQTMILHIGHPSCIAKEKTTVELAQLVF
jgi:hypothetical protein